MLIDNICLVDENTSQETLDELARVAGEAFLEEPWTREMLGSMNWVERKSRLARSISDGIFMGEMRACIENGCPCFYYTPEMSGVMVAYLSSELPDGIMWADLEEQGMSCGIHHLMSEEQLSQWHDKEDEMDASFVWDYPVAEHSDGSDFMHILSFAVRPDAHGTGVASRLMRPFLDKARELGVPVYLECLSDELESLYSHYGFEVVERRYVDGVEIHERIMVFNKKEDNSIPEKPSILSLSSNLTGKDTI